MKISIVHDGQGTTVSTQAGRLAFFTGSSTAADRVSQSRFDSMEGLSPYLSARSFNFVTRGAETFIMQGVLKNWEPELMDVESLDSHTTGLADLGFDHEGVGFQVRSVPYLLRLGRVDRLATA